MLRAIAASLLLTTYPAFSQSSPTPLHFDVASIKATSTVPDQWKGAGEAAISFSPDSATLRNATLRDVILAAYGLKDYQVAGPSWLTSSRYDILAKAAQAAPPDQLKQMLQQLLAERCNLQAHRESRELATQTLAVGKSGPKFQEAASDGPPVLRFTGTGLLFQNYSMSRLADYLTQHSSSPVVDQTGLSGTYNLPVKLLAGDAESPVEVKIQLGATTKDGTLPALIAEQLGLKLEARKAPLDVLVIDRVEKPSGN